MGILGVAGGRLENTVAEVRVGRSHGEEYIIEGDETVIGGDGHSRGGNMLAEVKILRM